MEKIKHKNIISNNGNELEGIQNPYELDSTMKSAKTHSIVSNSKGQPTINNKNNRNINNITKKNNKNLMNDYWTGREKKNKEKMDQIIEERNRKLYGDIYDKPKISKNTNKIINNIRIRSSNKVKENFELKEDEIRTDIPIQTPQCFIGKNKKNKSNNKNKSTKKSNVKNKGFTEADVKGLEKIIMMRTQREQNIKNEINNELIKSEQNIKIKKERKKVNKETENDPNNINSSIDELKKIRQSLNEFYTTNKNVRNHSYLKKNISNTYTNNNKRSNQKDLEVFYKQKLNKPKENQKCNTTRSKSTKPKKKFENINPNKSNTLVKSYIENKFNEHSNKNILNSQNTKGNKYIQKNINEEEININSIKENLPDQINKNVIYFNTNQCSQKNIVKESICNYNNNKLENSNSFFENNNERNIYIKNREIEDIKQKLNENEKTCNDMFQKACENNNSFEIYQNSLIKTHNNIIEKENLINNDDFVQFREENNKNLQKLFEEKNNLTKIEKNIEKNKLKNINEDEETKQLRDNKFKYINQQVSNILSSDKRNIENNLDYFNQKLKSNEEQKKNLLNKLFKKNEEEKVDKYLININKDLNYIYNPKNNIDKSNIEENKEEPIEEAQIIDSFNFNRKFHI